MYRTVGVTAHAAVRAWGSVVGGQKREGLRIKLCRRGARGLKGWQSRSVEAHKLSSGTAGVGCQMERWKAEKKKKKGPLS